MKKCVCLIGKPNVGKSIILDEAGITRDRIYGNVTYNNKNFSLIDTGGITTDAKDFNTEIKMQAELAIDEASTILFVVDGENGLDQSDYFIRDMLIKAHKEVIVLVNKIDNEKRKNNIYEFYELGFSNIIPISGEHKIGFTELLEMITKDMPEEVSIDDKIPRICIIGRPNVGKSSLVNALINEERSIVSDIAGTTRDSIDTKFTYNKQDYIIVDTAGMRKKGRIYENVEKYSYLRSMRSIDEADVCIVVISAEEGIIEHDKHILGYALDAGKGVVLVVNKWDTISNPNEEIKKWQEKIAHEFQFATYINTVFLSAKNKKRIHTLMPEVVKAYENNQKIIPTSLLNNVIMDAVSLNPPPTFKNKRLKIYFASVTDLKPPKITFQVNNKTLIHFSYERYLENKIRENFDLTGTPLVFQFKNHSEK